VKNYIILFLGFLSISMQAQDTPVDLSYYLPDNITYDTNIPTPESVIGHQVGEWHITHDKLVEYMRVLAASSDRISIEERGTTFEDRPLLLLTITSAKNHSNLEDIRNAHLDLTNNPNNNVDKSDMPIVVYQGFSIHGNEASGSNASLAVAYYLAAGQGKEIDDLLNEVVILFDPSYNPDGLQRFAYWANTNRSMNINPDPNDREYREVWPGGRTNHYYFDMNRDWLPVQLPESRARIASFHKWQPNILTDHHEMGSNASFFFQPGIPSRTHPLTPKMNQELTERIGDFHAAALDEIGSLYYTKESFDDFYYGKGSTFPDINGGIGILFEQASSRGHAQMTDNGLLTFPFTIRNQFTAALSTLEAAKSLRTDILDYQQDFYRDAKSEANKAKGSTIVFGGTKDAAKTTHLAEILDRHQIEIYELKEDTQQGGNEYKKGYSYAVPLNQKNHKLINAMFEKRTSFTDSLFYDVSAWTFPLAFDVKYDYVKSGSSILGDLKQDVQLKTGSVDGSGNYAFLMEWHEYYSPKALYEILSKDLRAKVALKEFSLEGNSYDYGTIMIPAANQNMSPQEIRSFLQGVAERSHLEIKSVSTGLTEGIDLGSNNFRALKLPKIAMIVGGRTSSYDAGEIWHLLDTRFAMPITKIDKDYFDRVDLSEYSTVIMVNGGNLDSFATEKLKNWIKDGGNLVAYRYALNYLKSNEILDFETVKAEVKAENISFEQQSDFRGAQVIGGAIFGAKQDRSHPINFGYEDGDLSLFRNTTLFIKAKSGNYLSPIQYLENPLQSGYISEENAAVISNTVPFLSSGFGSGNVIGFTDNTNFRAFWYGTNKLLMNAIFFADMM
jgi:hypothetical protein